MTDQDHIDYQVRLLAQYRTNLMTLLLQKAQYDAASAPLSILNSIRHARGQIGDIKRELRRLNQRIEDSPTDEPAAWAWDEFDGQLDEQFDWENAKQIYLSELRRLY